MRVFLACMSVLLAACATVPRDAGFDGVRADVASRTGHAVQWRRGGVEDAAAEAQVHALLAQPLSADAAVEVALLENRVLQAEYEELGVAQADLVQAGLLRNPVFGWSRQAGGDITKTAWGVELDFLGVLLAAPRQRIEGIRFEHAKLRVAQAVLRHAHQTRIAWIEAVAAAQNAGFMEQVADLVSAEAELGERQRKAGNLARRNALRQQAFAAETAAMLARAREAAFLSRERLSRLMGLGDASLDWALPHRLPELPVAAPKFDDIETWGLRQRLDLQMAQRETEALAAALNSTRSTRFVNVLGLGVETEKSTGERRITGPRLSFELPVFDQGQARVSRQEAQYRQSEARLYAMAVDARSEIREGMQRVETAYAVARQQRDVLESLYRGIVEESLLHYNGMLIGVYELLADARAQIGAMQASIAATRDFWVALADLQMAVGGRLPEAGGPMAEERLASPSTPIEEKHDHSHTHEGHVR